MNNNMKYKSMIKSLLFLLIGVTISMGVSAEDLQKIVSLAGYWKFSIGDNSAWAASGFDDRNWDEIRVPGRWEDNGYADYNGYAWYRKKFTIAPVDEDTPIYLIFGRIDDVDEVYINGKRLDGTGSFLPNFKTAYNERRKYIVPKEYLSFTATNTVAVRVYDYYLEGGIINNPVGFYVDEDNLLLDYDLSGQWKFHLGDNKQWRSESVNDELWSAIKVPAAWENEGYDQYDGYAWYRTKFRLPDKLKNQTLYLVLGKIDDYDYVYLNGTLIGSVFELDKDNEYKRKGYEYNARRIYKIPADVLNKDGGNTIAVRVLDGQIRGGIYEGPIGIMTEENCKKTL